MNEDSLSVVIIQKSKVHTAISDYPPWKCWLICNSTKHTVFS